MKNAVEMFEKQYGAPDSRDLDTLLPEEREALDDDDPASFEKEEDNHGVHH